MSPPARSLAWRPSWGRYALLWVRMAFGSHSLISGLNHFIPLFSIAGGGDPALSPIGAFMDELIATGLYDLIKLVETAVGVCLLANRFVPLAAFVELPISVGIAWLCLFVDGSPNIIFSGLREIGFNLFILACYADRYLPIFVWKAQYRPIWSADVRTP